MLVPLRGAEGGGMRQRAHSADGEYDESKSEHVLSAEERSNVLGAQWAWACNSLWGLFSATLLFVLTAFMYVVISLAERVATDNEWLGVCILTGNAGGLRGIAQAACVFMCMTLSAWIVHVVSFARHANARDQVVAAKALVSLGVHADDARAFVERLDARTAIAVAHASIPSRVVQEETTTPYALVVEVLGCVRSVACWTKTRDARTRAFSV